MYYIKNIIQIILSSIGGGLFSLPDLTYKYPSIFGSFIICTIFITIFALLITKRESCFIIIEKNLGWRFSNIIQYCYWFSSSCFVGVYINNIINTIIPNIMNYSIITVLLLKSLCFILLSFFVFLPAQKYHYYSKYMSIITIILSLLPILFLKKINLNFNYNCNYMAATSLIDIFSGIEIIPVIYNNITQIEMLIGLGILYFIYFINIIIAKHCKATSYNELLNILLPKKISNICTVMYLWINIESCIFWAYNNYQIAPHREIKIQSYLLSYNIVGIISIILSTNIIPYIDVFILCGNFFYIFYMLIILCIITNKIQQIYRNFNNKLQA